MRQKVLEPFVLSFEIHYNLLVPASSTFSLSISTKFLLKLMLTTWHLCADATYKLICQGFPVLISGTTDLQRHFHPVSVSICSNEAVDDFTFIFSALKDSIGKIHNQIYQPTILIADGAEQITNALLQPQQTGSQFRNSLSMKEHLVQSTGLTLS